MNCCGSELGFFSFSPNMLDLIILISLCYYTETKYICMVMDKMSMKILLFIQ